MDDVFCRACGAVISEDAKSQTILLSKVSQSESEQLITPIADQNEATTSDEQGNTLFRVEKYAVEKTFHREGNRLQPNNADHSYKTEQILNQQNRHEEGLNSNKDVDPQPENELDKKTESKASDRDNNGGCGCGSWIFIICVIWVIFHFCYNPFIHFIKTYFDQTETISVQTTEDVRQFNTGVTLVKQNRYVEAEPFLRKAAQIKPNSAIYQAGLGIALFDEQKYVESEAYLREAVHLRDSVTVPDREFATYIYSYAMALRDVGDVSEANLELFIKTLAALKRDHQQETVEYAKLLFGLGWFELTRSELDRAEEYSREGLSLAIKIHGSNHPDVADFYNAAKFV